MSYYGPQLPTNKKALARVIQAHVDSEKSKQSYTRMMWTLCYWYLCGARKFKIASGTGQIVQHWNLDKEGNLLYQASDLISIIDKVSARLATMDLWPSVTRNDRSIRSLRERASAQIILDSITSEEQLAQVKKQFAHIFTSLGACGLYSDLQDHPTVGLTLGLEVVHPTEIFPFPSLGFDFTKQCGITRNRVVPLSFLKARLGTLSKNALDNDVIAWRQKPTDPLERRDDGTPGDLMQSTSISQVMPIPNGDVDSDKEDITVVDINELWTYGPRGTVSRYVVTSGDHVFLDQDFEKEGAEVYCPLSYARFMDNGTFYGAGVFNLLYSLVRNYERLMESLFTNVRDIDRYGFVVIPAGDWDQQSSMREVGRGLRMIQYTPDIAGDSFRPFVVQPHNAGDMPGKTAAFAKSAIADINPIRDLAEEKGRVDSAAGLQYLDDQLNRAMTNPSDGVQRCFAGAYRAGASAAARALFTAPRSLAVSRLDLNLVGAVVDESGERVSFTKNPLPRIGNLAFTVREVAPRSPAIRKQEAQENLRLQFEMTGMGDWDKFLVWCVREGIDIAWDVGTEKAAVNTIITQILRLFNDGETPGEIVDTPHLARPDIQRGILREFMAGPELRSATVEVQNAFIEYDQFLIEQSEIMLPEGVPTIEDAAATSLMFQQAQQQSQGLPSGQSQPAQGNFQLTA